jgi:UDP-3-O-[3-hydroxymyristoyl] glucosamine N-acyltransferase
MKRTLKEIADAVQARLVGEPTFSVSAIASIHSAKQGDLIFVENEENLQLALTSDATAIITGEFAIRSAGGKALLICSQPKLAFARAARLLMKDGQHRPAIEPTAAVHPKARIGNSVIIDSNVVIDDEAVVEDGTWIGANSVIGRCVRVGQGCLIYPNVTIYPNTRLGNRVIVHAGAVLGSDGFGYVRDSVTGRYEKFPQIGRLEIGDDVEIGANATVDRGALDATYISRGTKIDNLVHVGHNVHIGEDVVIAAQTGLSGSAVVESNVIIGGQVGIADHVRIENGAILGAQSGIPTKKIIRGKGVVFWGTPARPIREYLKELAVLANLAKKRKSRDEPSSGDD